MRVPFGPWTPDLPDLDSSALEDAAQCVPLDVGYGPYRAAEIPAGATTVTASVAGAWAGPTSKGVWRLYVGTVGAVDSRLWRTSISSTFGAFTDVSVGGGYSALATKWSIAIFGATALATNAVNAMQAGSSGSGAGTFANQSASASAPIANHLSVVRDFVFAANLESGSGYPVAGGNILAWCQINNPRRWTPSPRLQSDNQTLPSAADIVAMTGGDFAAIITTNSVWRATYVGSPVIFRFDEVAPGIGCAASGSAARFQNLTFFLGFNGFQVFDGQQVIPIGRGKVDGFFSDDANTALAGLAKVSSVIDPFNSLYIVSYPSTGNTAPDRLLMYHWPTQRWARASLTTEFIAPHLNYLSGTTTWPRGVLAIVGFDPTAHRMHVLTGAVQTPTFITGETQLFQDRRAFVQAVRPLVQASNTTPVITAQIGKRDRLVDSVTYTSAVSMNANGVCPFRSDGRYHRVRLDISGSFTHAIGLDLTARPSGQR